MRRRRHRRATSRAENLLMDLLRDNALRQRSEPGAEKPVRAQDDGRRRLWRARRRRRFLSRHLEGQKRSRLARTGKARREKPRTSTERLIGEYETRLQTEPDNLKLVRSLAELYTQKKQFDRALEFYDRIKTSGMGNDPSLDTAIANTIVRRFDHQISELNPFDADHAGAGGANCRRRNWTSNWPNARSAWKNFPPTSPSGLSWARCIFKPEKSARPSRNSKRRSNNPHKKIRRDELSRAMFRAEQDVRLSPCARCKTPSRKKRFSTRKRKT